MPGHLHAELPAPAFHRGALPERPVAITTRDLAQPTANTARAMSSITDGTWTLHYRGNEEAWDLFNLEEDPAQEESGGVRPPRSRAAAQAALGAVAVCRRPG